MRWYDVLAGYLAVMSLWAFFAMGWDKRQAKREGRRVAERTLFLLALAGGSPGALAGMYAFRHKTRHWYFRLGLPAIPLLQIGAGVWLRLRFLS